MASKSIEEVMAGIMGKPKPLTSKQTSVIPINKPQHQGALNMTSSATDNTPTVTPGQAGGRSGVMLVNVLIGAFGLAMSITAWHFFAADAKRKEDFKETIAGRMEVASEAESTRLEKCRKLVSTLQDSGSNAVPACVTESGFAGTGSPGTSSVVRKSAPTDPWASVPVPAWYQEIKNMRGVGQGFMSPIPAGAGIFAPGGPATFWVNSPGGIGRIEGLNYKVFLPDGTLLARSEEVSRSIPGVRVEVQSGGRVAIATK